MLQPFDWRGTCVFTRRVGHMWGLIMRTLTNASYLLLAIAGVTIASIVPAAASIRLPEPMSLSLVAGGVIAIAAVARKRRK